MEADLTHENFAKHLNSEFGVDRDGEKIQLTLIQISELKRTDRQEHFSIIFRGPLDHPLVQAIHQFRHSDFGDFEMFIVPIDKKPEGYQYEAVFNRFVQT